MYQKCNKEVSYVTFLLLFHYDCCQKMFYFYNKKCDNHCQNLNFVRFWIHFFEICFFSFLIHFVSCHIFVRLMWIFCHILVLTVFCHIFCKILNTFCILSYICDIYVIFFFHILVLISFFVTFLTVICHIFVSLLLHIWTYIKCQYQNFSSSLTYILESRLLRS